MTDEQSKEIRRRLDEDLSLDEFERDYRSTGEAATQFFQDLFVQVLNFDETMSALGDATWQDIPVHEWPKTARANAARLFAEAGNFRVIYVELEKLTRTAERNAVQSLTRSDRTSGWAIDGSFLTVFHASDEDIWHLVTPYEEGTDKITTGRPVLRRYTLGEGETHRTVANALSSMDASKGRLAERIDEAFRVKPVTEDFYQDYKNALDTLSDELDSKGLGIEAADRYAHMTLNRLMFFYYLQKKGWIGERKDFVHWLHERYEESGEDDQFHEKWLSVLFFDGMNRPVGEDIEADLPEDVESVISGLPYMNGGLFQPTEEDQNGTFLSDSALSSVIRGFLDQYNFTVTEESPYDIDVAVDPAMLGKIYESLIAEQERGEAGIFYTPRVEVDLMCRMALYEQFCDHANNLDAEGKQRVVEFIFSEPQDWDAESAGETEQLEDILHELRIVDPACGSGAFLVGMKQVVTELYRKLGTTPDYHLKEQIINENLYGVDIKDWAVRVAEFRLWLSLVEGEEQVPDQRPILPNFSFKLKVGDSLVQKLDEEFVSLDALTRTLDGDTGGLLTELKELKREHFEGEADRKEEIEEKQVELLRRHISGLIDNLSDDGAQQTLFGDTRDDEIDENTEKRIEELKQVRDAIDKAGDAGFFMWDIDFSDVMVEDGFDVVIGNPPYVRQREIIDQGIHPERLEQMDSDEVKTLKSQYKNDLVNYVEETFGISPYKRSDLYVYFLFKGLDVLRDGGSLTYITSNSWLDVNYGQRLQEGLLKLSNINNILDNRAGPIFDEADVNTVITSAQRTATSNILSGETSFVTFHDHYEDLVQTDVMQDVFVGSGETSTIEYRNETISYTPVESGRRVSLPEVSMWRLGGGVVQDEADGVDKVYSERTGVDGVQAGLESYNPDEKGPIASGSYSGEEKWSQYLQAPDIYFEILNRNQDVLVPLQEVADLFRGCTTGNNTFFYPDQEAIGRFDLPDKYLHPTMKSPRPLQSPLVTEDDLDTRMAIIPEGADDPEIQQYIEYGEDEGIDSGTTVSARDPWYDLSVDAEQAKLFWQKAHYTKHIAYYSEQPFYLDQQFYGIEPHSGIDEKLLAAILNSSYYALMKILYGREMSGRSIKAAVYEVAKFPVPDPGELDNEEKQQLLEAFDQIKEKDMTDAIYDQFDDPSRERIDGALFDILGLSEEEQNEVYESVETLTRQIRERDKQR